MEILIGGLLIASGLALGAVAGYYEERERRREIQRRIGLSDEWRGGR